MTRNNRDHLRVTPATRVAPPLASDDFSSAAPRGERLDLRGEVLDFRTSRRQRYQPASRDESFRERSLRDEAAPRRRVASPDSVTRGGDAALTSPATSAAPPEAPLSVAQEPMTCPPCHRLLLLFTIILSVLSIPLVYSASTALALEHYGDPNFFLLRQVGFVVVGLGIMLWASRQSAETIRRMVWVLYAVALVGLVLIAFTPLGTDLGSGTKRWLKMGPLPPQQFSELAKIALVGVLADLWSRAARDPQRKGWPWLTTAALSLPLIGLVYKQPHFSATLLLFLLPLAIAFYTGASLKQLGRILIVFALLGAVGFAGMKPYQRERLTSHFATKDDPRGTSYQALQGRRALIHGGLMGTGIGRGTYANGGYLPAPHTDFILAVIGEEWGFVGMASLTLVYGLMIFFCFHTGHSSRNGFEALMCAGMGTILAVQFIGNAGVVTGVLPVTGMPLPILSYGGSGLWCSLLGIGLVLGISRGHGGEATTPQRVAAVPVEDAPVAERTMFDQSAVMPENDVLMLPTPLMMDEHGAFSAKHGPSPLTPVGATRAYSER